MTAEIHRMSDYQAPALIPKALQEAPGWLVWRLTQRPGEPKPRKVPFYANGCPRGWPKGRPPGKDPVPTAEMPRVDQGDPLDLGAMVSYERAVAACIKGHFTGIGWAPSPNCGIVALDFDNCVVDGLIDPRIEAVIDGTYAEISPSGNGVRAFFKGSLPSRKDNADKSARRPDGSRLDGKFDVEFFGHNGFVTVTGNATDSTTLFGLEGTVAPLSAAVMSLFRERFGEPGQLTVSRGATGADDDLLDLGIETQGWTLDQVREVLMDCDPECSREQWVNALMAVHHETDGSEEGLDLADEWSAQASKYGGRADVEGRWRSFRRRSGGTITGIWLKAWRRECQAHEKYDAQTEWKQKLAAAPTEFELREKLCPQIVKDDRLDEIVRGALAQELKTAFKRLGTVVQVSDCRKMLTPPASEKAQDKSKAPKWMEGWVFVTEKDKLYRMDSDEWVTQLGFNAKFNRLMPRNQEGEVMKSAYYAAVEDHDLKTVTRGQYLPWGGPIFEMDGVECVNLYRPSSVPKAVEFLSVEGQRAVDVVLRHIRLIAGGREAVVSVMVDWLAHNTQKPSVKVRWAPLIKGFPGDGKTVFGQLVAAVIGRVNVGSVTPTVLATDFTGWARNKAVVVLEEIKLTGHNKHDIINRLKPFITNDVVEVHPKGQDSRDEINTVNYLAFTNYVDALPLEETDRRWWVIFTPYDNAEALAEALREFVGAGDTKSVVARYFKQLHTAINTQGAELRRWLLDHQISSSFEADGTAPMTDEKAVMIGMQVSDDESALAEVIEAGGPGISREIFTSSHLREQVVLGDSDVNTSTSAWSRLLTKMGYTRLPKKIKWRGRAENVWVRGHRHMEPEAARQLLNKTMPDGQEGSENDDLF